MYNDIVTTIGRGNGAMLVLLDLSAAFDTMYHDNLFCIPEKYVGICENALKLIKSYFSNRTQRVQIDDVLLDVANIICGIPQGSVLGPLNTYADDTKLYISFKCKQPLDIWRWLNVEAHIFILETLGIYYRIMVVLLLFMHLLVVD